VKVKYVGPHDEVEVPLANVTCKRGDSVDVPDDVGLELIKQDSWDAAPTRVSAKSKD
jgi:hypothetical protein